MFKKYVPEKSLSWADMEDEENEINSNHLSHLSFSYLDKLGEQIDHRSREGGFAAPNPVGGGKQKEIGTPINQIVGPKGCTPAQPSEEGSVDSVPKRRWETISRKKKRKNKCFICNKQRKHINEHFILEKNNIVFYHDMCGRPMILAFPLRHITNFKDNDSTFIGNMFRTIEEFCNELELSNDCSLVYDFNHSEHLKIKIKVNEHKIKDIRDHHFKIKQIEKIENQKHRKKMRLQSQKKKLNDN